MLIIFSCSFFCSVDLDRLNAKTVGVEQISDIGDSCATKNGAVFLPVVMYHAMRSKVKKIHSITPKQLRNDFEWIKKEGFSPIFVQDLLNFVDKKATLPKNPIILTFDDGLYNFYKLAYPLILEYGYKAVVSVVGWYTDQNYNEDILKNNFNHIDYTHINTMKDSGVIEIISHTYDLHHLNKNRRGAGKNRSESVEQYKTMLKSDLTKWHERLKEKTGITMQALAYPYGIFNKHATEVVKDIYRVAFTCARGINIIVDKPGKKSTGKRNTNLLTMSRINRSGHDNTDGFFNAIKHMCI